MAKSTKGDKNMPNKIKHLEMIEAIIERMAKNCFQLKTWTMTLVAATLALSAKGTDRKFLLFIFIPIVGFWLLDTFYLQTERKFKILYRNVAGKDEKNIDFNLDTSLASRTTSDMKCLSFFRCMFSTSEILFYPFIIVAAVVLIIVLKIF